ncbi:FAD-binding oxidoreductase [Symbioplanes lichenis]|uniref:FAD-binding oxidoreductase n=1 Tax=Symbioplanes lichenis TaxID=1629072 RepID=UPI002738A3EB|nr:FAD-binding oxidoreductase [Actinoplanes lichenis]
MTVQVSSRAVLAELAGSFTGEVLTQSDPGYDDARTIWNADVTRRPALILRCRRTEDVVTAVRFARRHGFEVSVRGGGHNIAGTALCHGGVMIDLSLMRHVQVDAGRRRAVAEPGATWFDMDTATQRAGLATPGGVVSSTGVAGLTLGGGFGWLSRRFGWACDNLEAVELVTAAGLRVRADETENSELFWGIRGGGGNFGVVTSFRFRLHPVTHVYAGFLVYEMDRAAEVLRYCRDLMNTAPDALCFVISLGPPPQHDRLPLAMIGKRVLRVSFCHSGPIDEARTTIARFATRHRPRMAQYSTVSYGEVQKMLDRGARFGLAHYSKSHFLPDLPDEAIETMIHHVQRAISPMSRAVLHTCGGMPSRLPEDATAFGHRGARYNLQIDATWQPGDDRTGELAWARDFGVAMQPFGSGGVYVNFLSDHDDPAGVLAAYQGDRLLRLRRLKSRYDPDNFFRHNQNISPLPVDER